MKYFYDVDGKQFEIISYRRLTLWQRLKILFGGAPPNITIKGERYVFTGKTHLERAPE